MATTRDPRPNLLYDEPPVKPPPLLVAGPLHWMRENLFKSTFDTILTIVAGIGLLALIAGFLGWAITQANWLVITRNFRLFMVGLFPVDEMWRVNLGVLISAFSIGFTTYAFIRIKWRTVIAAAAALIVMAAIVPLTYMIFPPTATYMAVGETTIQSGTAAEQPQTQIAFLGRTGDVIRVVYAPEGSSDEGLTSLQGFADRASGALFNNALNRFATQNRIADLQAQLAGDMLTDEQRISTQETLDGLSVPDAISQTYMLNQPPIIISILDGSTLEPLATGELSPEQTAAAGGLDAEGNPILPPVFEFTLPADGWYVLDKRVPEGVEATAVISVLGLSPIMERNLTNANEYIRLSDEFKIVDQRPEVNDRELPFVSVTDNTYRGAKTFGDFMRLYGAPMLEILLRGLIPAAIAAGIGGLAAMGLVRSRPKPPRNQSETAAARAVIFPLWALTLTLFFILLYGVRGLSPLELGNLLAGFVWVGWMFFAGVNIRHAWGKPLLALIMVLGIAQFALAQNLTPERAIDYIGDLGANGSRLSGALFNVAIWLLVGYFAARQGAARGGQFTARQGVLGILVTAGLWIATLVLPALIINILLANDQISPSQANNLLPVVDTRRWGGLLLTMALTVTAILASFPLGIMLALGRRSSLPLVKGVCTVYIELVRGVPLITVLFMAQLLVPLLNPSLATVENVIRAMIGLTLFSAAYLAENVRGGLQSLPPGQEEAARALGLSSLQITLLVTLPQALRAVIPALVGQCIALFKDTSLVALVGLLDLTGIAKSVTAQPEFVGLQSEAYIFISVVYFIFSYVMAYISRRIEASGSGAVRRFG